MAFNLQNFDKLTGTGVPTLREGWSNLDTDSTIAAQSASGYFNDVAKWLKIGDFIYLRGSNGNGKVNVTAVTPNVTVQASTDIAAGSVGLAELATAVAPSHVVKFAGQHTTVGGDAAEAITVTGALATDLAFVQMVDNGTDNRTIVDAVVTSNTLTVTFSGNPGDDAIINYQLIRATS